VTEVEVVIENCLTVYLAPLLKYDASKIMGSRPWLFGVTWRHRSRDHSTRDGRLPRCGPLRPSPSLQVFRSRLKTALFARSYSCF